MLRNLLFSISLILSASAQAAVWTEVNDWSATYENRFAEWVRSEWRVDFFSRKYLPNGQNNPYYGLRVDCADTVYSMRIIFAYENRLPFVAQDPTASGKTISNKMSRWDKENEITRVRNFLWFIYETMSTRSLPNDTYPIAISRDTIRSGALMATTKKNHHSWTVKEILPIGVPHLVFNSVVGSNSGYGLQERQSWPNPDWVFETDFTPAGNAGFRYWRPASYINKPVWEVPGYSEEQYRIPLNKWVRYVQNRLALRQETDNQLITRLMKTTCEGLTGRVIAVNDGLGYLKKNSRCMDYATYDTYSTPNRDRRVFDDFMSLRRSYREILQINGGNQLSADLVNQLNKIFPAIQKSVATEAAQMAVQGQTASSVCVTEYLPGQSMDLAEFKRRLFLGLISNNPHDDGSYRWGELRGPSQRARSCQSWDPWSPDLNQE
ncbi:MAG: hypothetical protein KUL82_03000 [Bdellovibrio sp.]|nr:hypothetical protein [Bdellovibrio sp.]